MTALTSLRSIRWTFVAAIVITLFAVPVSISPAGSVEVDGVCASAECARKYGSYCFDSGEMYPDARVIVTEID